VICLKIVPDVTTRKRNYISLSEKLAACLAEKLSEPEKARAILERWDASRILSRFDWDHVNPVALGGPDRWWNLQPLLRSGQHAAKTKDDLKKIAKAKRFEKRRAQLLTSPPTDLKPGWRWPSRKLQSRPFARKK
jgi:hypothetical protein